MSMVRFFAVAAAGLVVVSSAFAADGTVAFTGAITGQTCAISGAGANLRVVLPNVNAGALAAAGTVAGRTPFTLSLTGCATSQGALSSVAARFEPGASVDQATGRLVVDAGEGSAQNLQVRLLGDAQQPINAGAAGDQGSRFIPISSAGAATLNYFAEYYATGQVTAGSVSTRAQFTLMYQ